MATNRDNFSSETRDRLSQRVCYKCSRCMCPTTGPSGEGDGSVRIGVAAHIAAAAEGGPRFDASQTPEQRKSFNNGIWLCSNCSKTVDDDVKTFTAPALQLLKRKAESVAREELALPPKPPETAMDWKAIQTSSIASYEVPLLLPVDLGTNKVDQDAFSGFSDQFNQLVSYAFGHACMVTDLDRFNYVLCLEADDRESPLDRKAMRLSVHCHVTAFMWALEQMLAHFIEGRIETVSAKFRSLPGEQCLEVHPHFAKFVPHRIERTGANRIKIQHLAGRPIPMDNGVPTSTLLRVLALTLNHDTIIWDGADDCPDWEKLMTAMVKISDADHFKWSHFKIDRNDPEIWEYIGPAGTE